MATELLSLVAKLGIDDKEYKKGVKGAGEEAEGFAGKMKKVMKGAAVAIGAATTAVVAIGKKSIQSYSEYEQMVGGVKKLYGNMGLSVEEYAKQQGKSIAEVKSEWQSLEDAQNLVLQNANNAYKTAGMSANQYMETATSFSAALINSLNGDTVEAAKQTDVAMQAISDNWNTFGGDLGMIQNAYQGFAKQNYTMLDNLKLGYGGTKNEMKRLIADANEYAKSIGQASDLSIDSFSDVVTAIELIQEKQNIAGTTAREAGTTIQGSLGMAKAAWENLLTGMSDKNADVGQLIENLVVSIVGDGTDTNKGVLGNLIPVIETTLGSIGKLISGLGESILPQIIDLLPKLLDELLPEVLNLLQSLFNSITEVIPDLIPVLLNALPLILDAGLQIILALVSGITDNIPMLIPAIVEVVTQLVTMLTEPDVLVQLITAAIDLILALADGLVDAIPKLISVVPTIVTNLVRALIKLAPKLVTAAVKLIGKLAEGFLKARSSATKAIGKIFEWIHDKVKEYKLRFKEWARDMMSNFIKGIGEKFRALKDKFIEILNWIKERFHFSVPDVGPLADADKWMPDFMDLLASGIDDNKFKVVGAMDDLAGQMTLGDTGDRYTTETEEDVQRFEFTFAEGNAPLKQIARLLFPYMQVVAKEKGVKGYA